MAVWTEATKNTASYSNDTKHTAGASWDTLGYMLQENTFFLLLETGGKIVLNWGTTKNTSSWTNITKN